MIVLPNQTFLWKRTTNSVLSEQLLQAIDLARLTAIAEHEQTTVCHSADQKTCSGEWRNGYIVQTNTRVVYAFQNTEQPGQLYWRSFPANQPTLVFSATGQTMFENGTFWYCEDHATQPSFAIVISQTGRARLVSPNKEGNMDLNIHC